MMSEKLFLYSKIRTWLRILDFEWPGSITDTSDYTCACRKQLYSLV